MHPIGFSIPFYPCRHRFSDPYIDFEGEEEDLARIAALAPAQLSALELRTIFNGWLPAGTFEEMAPYVPCAFRYVRDLAEEPKSELSILLLEDLIIWCHKEQASLEQKEHQKLLRSIQDAFMQLFHHWTGQTVTTCESGEPSLLHDTMIDIMVSKGDELATYCQNHRKPLPWLRSTHFLPHLTALDSVPHAAWTLMFCKTEVGFIHRRHVLPAATMERALDIVEDWLLSGEATANDLAIWDDVATKLRFQLRFLPFFR